MSGSTTVLERLFGEAMSWAAVFGNVMPTEAWDAARDAKAKEYAAKVAACEVTEDRTRGNDSMFGLLPGEQG